MKGSDADRAAYWDTNLDPQNLGGAMDPAAALAAEKPFYDVPDQLDALAALEPRAGRLILEIGTGLGLNALAMSAAGASVAATDISLERLRALRAFHADEAHCDALWPLPAGAQAGRLLLVRCAAEALPFRRDQFDGACTRAVLIHTQLAQAMDEIHRTLKPGGVGAFAEPMTSNPFVVLYRHTFAPAEWRGITTYFSDRETETVAAPFAAATVRTYYLFSFLAFVWQYGLRAPRLFRVTLAALGAVDRALFAVAPVLRRFAWFVLVVGKKQAD